MPVGNSFLLQKHLVVWEGGRKIQALYKFSYQIYVIHLSLPLLVEFMASTELNARYMLNTKVTMLRPVFNQALVTQEGSEIQNHCTVSLSQRQNKKSRALCSK